MKYTESEKTELKEKFTDTLINEIVAFLNADGGSIYIGVDDNGEVVGIENSDSLLLKIADIVTSQIEPNPQELIRTELLFDEGKVVICITIQKGFYPIYCIKKYGYSSKGCPVRIGSSCREMSPDQITIRYAKRFSSLNDNMVRLPARYGDISFDILGMLLRNRGYHISSTSFEKNYQLRNENNDYNMLAELMSDNNNVPMSVVKFRGLDKSSISERSNYGHCCIVEAYQKILDRLKAENICKTDTTVRPRRDVFLYDIDAVNEVLLNAILHNDWNITEPLVCLFQDRLEIISHGGLPGNQTVEQFFNGITVPRNAALMRIFHDLDLAEHNGHGIPTIVAAYGRDVFEITDNYINVRIPFNKEVLLNRDNISGNISGNINGNLNESESKVVNAVLANSKKTIDDIVLETQIPKRTVSRLMADLQQKGFIVREGSRKNGDWKVL